MTRTFPVNFTARDTQLLILSLAAGVIALAFMLANSPGALLDDEITHYLISLNAWQYPGALLDVWGRVGNTMTYMLPAVIGGLVGRRIFAIALTALTAWVAARIGARLGVKHSWLIALCVLFQPWILEAAHNSITQVPFSLYMALGVWAWMAGRFGWAGFCFGLLALVRHEGIALTGAWVLYALLRRQWIGALTAVLPLAAYNLLFLLLFGRLASGNLLDVVPTTEYGSGDWLHFVGPLIEGVGVPILILMIIGVVTLARQPAQASGQHRPLIYFAPFALYFALHTVIYRFGLFASGGYGVFILPISAGAAVLAGYGASRLLPRARQAAPIVALVGALIIGGYGLLNAQTTPIDPLHAAQVQAAEWLRDQDADRATVYAAHIVFWADYDPYWPNEYQPWWYETAELPVGSLLVWDSKYGDSRGLTWEQITAPGSGWVERARFGDVDAGTAAVIFERTT